MNYKIDYKKMAQKVATAHGHTTYDQIIFSTKIMSPKIHLSQHAESYWKRGKGWRTKQRAKCVVMLPDIDAILSRDN